MERAFNAHIYKTMILAVEKAAMVIAGQ